jgi:hypothetical protein
MINRLIRRANKHSEKLVLPKIPLANKRSMRIGNTVNKIAGISLITYGLLSDKKWIISLGIASILANSFINNTFDSKYIMRK